MNYSNLTRNLTLLLAVLVVAAPATAHSDDHNFTGAKEIIAQETACSELTEDQLAEVGDYYMEQLHPGEMHDVMDEHMGGEGSESLRRAHLQIADEYYCSQFASSQVDQEGGRMPMMHNGWVGTGWFGMGGWFGFLIGLTLLILLILAIIYLIQKITESKEQE